MKISPADYLSADAPDRAVAVADHVRPNGAPEPARAANDGSSAAGMRIALFSGNYNCVRDGANRALNRLVDHLLARGAAVRVYSPTVAAPAFMPAGDLVPVPSVPIPGRSEFRIALGLPKSVREDVERFAPNLVHVSAPDLLGIGAQKLARRLDVPVVASLHTRFETYFDYYGLGAFRGWGERHLRRFYRASDHVLAPNGASAQSLVAMGVPEHDISTWGRGVDPAAFSPALRDLGWRRALGYRDDEIVPLFFGRLVLEKGIAAFADAIRLLRERGHELRPLIVGTGPAETRFRQLLPEAVFTGHLDGAALGRAVASADILINPSTTEAFGNVNLEAMASGIAIVSADVGSAQALIISGQSGLLTAASPDALADAAEQLIDQPNFRRAIAREAYVAAGNHRWPEILDRVVIAYAGLISE
ncbi:glycosyltransferase family 1 protein [Sphingomonas sp. HITSZ_GF]|uniref:glycosyltransferase family 4 protein n=1 Tax=Sphingomonas sp. HITSZ_GF TaxID=3037247 RepID=UPI00240E4B11|nr:glycosyltransferase family 1 protein [Sphingomonas sp. HITSZ_GF]MDG2535901.1 glycosyltransferase family 1 protein [Sphingomonas sp. HITSZ_GF]